jgi:hypothetical protein
MVRIMLRAAKRRQRTKVGLITLIAVVPSGSITSSWFVPKARKASPWA